MKRIARNIALLLAVAATSHSAFGQTQAAAKPHVAVYKSPTCGCCGKWIEYMQTKGYTTTVTNLADVAPIKVKYQVPPRVHTVPSVQAISRSPAASIATLDETSRRLAACPAACSSSH